MSAKVAEIIKNSIAEELELQKGDILLSIDGKKISDLIEYQYLLKSENIVIEIQNENNEIEEIEIEKDFDEDLGLVFESAVFDRIKPCCNKCIFCFVDQQPKGLRDTLYIKDDDYRLSYLQGTYVTLTNLTDKDRKFIEKHRLGPLYISVHTTNPELRVKMLRNPKASEIVQNLKWLQSLDIPFHAQIVLCPEYNDDLELKRTLDDLKQFKDVLLSLAIVPVGITKYRKEELKQVDKSVAERTIELVDDFNKELKKQLACVSDEFFFIAKKRIPNKKYYGNFSQLEDGVGAFRLLLDDFDKRKKTLPQSIKKKKTFNLITSEIANYIFQDIVKELNKIENLDISLNIIKSNFWGKDVNVAGLVVGKDIIEQLLPIKNELEYIIIPSIMLKSMSRSFLDGMTVKDVEKKLDCKILLVNDIYSTKDIINFIKK